jgi:hypothetical protein
MSTVGDKTMKKTTPNLTEQYATSYRGIVKRKGKIIYMSHHCNIFIKAADRANLYAARHGGTAYVQTCDP